MPITHFKSTPSIFSIQKARAPWALFHHLSPALGASRSLAGPSSHPFRHQEEKEKTPHKSALAIAVTTHRRHPRLPFKIVQLQASAINGPHGAAQIYGDFSSLFAFVFSHHLLIRQIRSSGDISAWGGGPASYRQHGFHCIPPNCASPLRLVFFDSRLALRNGTVC
jgi:hypothetical protein